MYTDTYDNAFLSYINISLMLFNYDFDYSFFLLLLIARVVIEQF